MLRIRCYFCVSLALLLFFAGSLPAKDPVFSGPQVGEKLPPLIVKGVFGKLKGKEIDLVERAKGNPTAIIFFHARTRPAFGMTNRVMKYAASKTKSGLTSNVVFLTDDPTETEKWVNRVNKNLPKGVTYGISLNGAEGPGSYGLNSNVTLTILVGNKGKVTGNYALVQPSLEADGPKVLKAIVDVTGGGKVPTIAQLSGPRYAGRERMARRPAQNDPELTSRLRALLNKQASPADVKKAAVEVERYVEKNKKARLILGRITTTVVGGDRFSTYGTKPAREVLSRWEKKYGPVYRETQKNTKRPDRKRIEQPVEKKKSVKTPSAN